MRGGGGRDFQLLYYVNTSFPLPLHTALFNDIYPCCSIYRPKRNAPTPLKGIDIKAIAVRERNPNHHYLALSVYMLKEARGEGKL
jgi:hypothetical protein